MRINTLTDYHKHTNRNADRADDCLAMQVAIKSALGNSGHSLRLALASLNMTCRQDLLSCLITGTGESIVACIERMDLLPSLRKCLSVAPVQKLLRIVEHPRKVKMGGDHMSNRILALNSILSNARYFNDVVAIFIHTLLEPLSLGVRVSLLKQTMISIHDDDLSVYVKQRMLKEIDPYYAKIITESSYKPPLLPLTTPFHVRVSPTTYPRLLESSTLTESQYIVLSCHQLRMQDYTELATELTVLYLAYDYSACLAKLKMLAVQQRSDLQWLTLSGIDQLKPVQVMENHTRRYFESVLARHYWGVGVVSDLVSIKNVCDFFRQEYTIAFDIMPSSKTTEQHVRLAEKALLDITDAEYVTGAKLWDRMIEIGSYSVAFHSTYRTNAPGMRTNYELANLIQHPCLPEGKAAEKLPSHATGIMKSLSPYFPDELAEKSQINRSADAYRLREDKPAWSRLHANIPFVSSVSGHAFYAVALLEEYAKAHKSAPDLNTNINAFVRAVVMAYVKNGFHSIGEYMIVFQEPYVTALFQAYGITIDFRLDEDLLDNAIKRSSDYCYKHGLKLRMNQSIEPNLIENLKPAKIKTKTGEISCDSNADSTTDINSSCFRN